MGGKGPIWLPIMLVPSESSAALESIKVLGSVLVPLGGQGSIFSRLCCGLSPALNAQSISAQAHSGGLCSASTWRLLQEVGWRLLEPCSTSVKKVGKGRSGADTLLQGVTMFSNS